MVMRLVLLVAVKVRGRPLGELAVTGRMSVLPAGMLALGMGSITGAATAEKARAPENKTALEKHRPFMIRPISYHTLKWCAISLFAWRYPNLDFGTPCRRCSLFGMKFDHMVFLFFNFQL